jgi:release factor glutamine methyltransferase
VTRLRQLRRSRREEMARWGGNPRDVDLLLAGLLGTSTASLIARDDREITDGEVASLDRALARRREGEPLQYIRGVMEFYGRELAVDSRVLIPRPETELAVAETVRRAPAAGWILDVGTGSGCIALAVALERPDTHVVASDISVEALAVARENIRRLSAPVCLVAADLLTSFRGTFEIIVSNPPYIPATEISSLQVEVRDHEPLAALTPGSDGLATIRRLFAESGALLRTGGALIMEIGFGQAEETVKVAEAYGWQVDAVIEDLASIPRVVVSSRPAAARPGGFA